jgi:hypothetical protein
LGRLPGVNYGKTKTAIVVVIDFNEANGVVYSKRKLYKCYGVDPKSAWR